MSLRINWHTFRISVRKGLEFLWFSYSTPTPQSATQILSLLLLCFGVSTATAALLFHWLSGILVYNLSYAGIATSIYVVAVFVLLFFVHPVRCAFTLIFPTLGTRQGRKLILSLCVMIVVIYILPNIATNIVALTHIMKCTSENLAHSLLNSSELINSIKSDMVDKVKQIQNFRLELVEHLNVFNHSTEINVAGLRNSLKTLSKHIEGDFYNAKLQLDELKLLSRRIFAAILVFYLFMDSSMYLKSYLTSVTFDNVYITGMLKSTTFNRGIEVEAKDIKNVVKSNSFRMTKGEMLGCLSPILLITMYLLMTTMLIILDHILHYAVVTGGPWLLDIPPTVISMNIHFKVDHLPGICELFGCKQIVLVNFNRNYSVTISSDFTWCEVMPSKPSMGVLLSLVLLYFLSYCLAFLEVYARRLRRKVASSFFQEQEEKRIRFLIKKILTKRSRQAKKLRVQVSEPKITESMI